ncbi:MAG: hypothetical protein M3Y33_05410 [Actinomycetota bacterium]|nr:hypothetical protein [Actinomycetota bacterium]
MSGFIAAGAGAHFTAREFRTWNATVLMALAIAASVREVAEWLGDTPAVARSSYLDPGLISRYPSQGELAGIPRSPARAAGAPAGRSRRRCPADGPGLAGGSATRRAWAGPPWPAGR